MNENKIQSDLCFLKKSGNEKNIVKRIGEKMKRPTPGENNNPNIGMIIEVWGIKTATTLETSVILLVSKSIDRIIVKLEMYLLKK